MTKKKLEERVRNIENRLSVWWPIDGVSMFSMFAEHKLEDVVKAILENLELRLTKVYPTPSEIKTVAEKKNGKTPA